MTSDYETDLSRSMFQDAATEDTMVAALVDDEAEEDLDTLAARVTVKLENRILDRHLQRLAGPDKRPEDVLDDAQIFLRGGFLGIDLDTRSKLITRLEERKREG